MARSSRSHSALVFCSLVTGGCLATTVPIGSDNADGGNGDASVDAATSSSSGAGSSSSSSTGGSSTSGSSSSSGGSSSSSGGGACCPANYSLYSCTYPDGGAGMACHNPALGCASSQTCGLGCDPVVSGRCGGSSSSSGASSSSGGQGLQWYWTCGYPSCPAPAGDGGLTDDAGAACPAVGSSCSVQGEKCGTSTANVHCGATLECSSQDPTRMLGGCPISSRRFKDDVGYVGSAGLQELHDETLRIRLATYNYKNQVADPNPKHLGFIIEDTPPESPAVEWSRDRVDMYGYLSMAIATMQVQEKEIEALRRDLAESRAGVCR